MSAICDEDNPRLSKTFFADSREDCAFCGDGGLRVLT
jgi:hypothetical protein